MVNAARSQPPALCHVRPPTRSGISSMTGCLNLPDGRFRSTKKSTPPRQRPTTAIRASPVCSRVSDEFIAIPPKRPTCTPGNVAERKRQGFGSDGSDPGRWRRESHQAAVYALFCVVALEAALNFSVPLYIQIVQGRSPIATAVATMPFNLTVFFTAMLIVRFYDKFTPRQSDGFILCTVALLWLAFCRA
jgi:hypothetical protein